MCTESRPSTAFHHFAAAVTSGGGELRYHGDFGWPVIAIAAVRADAGYVPLSGPPQPTPWDPSIAAVMRSADRAVYEESVADALSADLAAGCGLTG